MTDKKTNAKSISLTALFLLILIAFFAICVAFCYLGARCTASIKSERQASVEAELLPCIILDPGHGGEDGGTVGKNGVAEKELNLKIALALRDLLECGGYKVILTRTEDLLLYDKTSDYKGHKKQQDLATRLDIARNNPDAIFISIHMNAFSEQKYNGLQVYYSKNNSLSEKLADIIQTDTEKYLQPYNKRKTKAAGNNIYLLDRMKNPSVLVECGFLSNDAECERLSDAEYRKKLAFLMFCSISDYLNERDSDPQ